MLAQIIDRIGEIGQRLAGVEGTLAELSRLAQQGAGAGAEWMSTTEVAAEVGRSEFTVRQWCARGRLRGQKTENGREWRVHRAELQRYRKEGLLPSA